MIARVLAAALLVVLAASLLVAAWPQLFRLEWVAGVAHVVSLRGLAAAVALVAALLLGVVAARSVRGRRLAASMALLLLAFVGLSLAVLSSRGFGNAEFEQKTEGDLTVLAWNTLGDAPGPERIADLALEVDADVISLPETTEETGNVVAELMAEAGQPMHALTSAFDEVSKARSTTLLVSTALGEYRVDDSEGNTTVLPTVIARSPGGPTLVAVHAVAPIEGELSHWRADLEWLAQVCKGGSLIMAGDFNATLDHFGRLAPAGSELGACADAALASENASVGTWPTWLPPVLGSPIDHVMFTAAWRVTGMEVIGDQDSNGSDHRPIVVQLSPAE